MKGGASPPCTGPKSSLDRASRQEIRPRSLYTQKSGSSGSGGTLEPETILPGRNDRDFLGEGCEKDERSTEMWQACYAGELGVMEWLCKHGASGTIRTPDIDGRTPMWVACWLGYTTIAKWLYENGAVDGISTRDEDGVSPLAAACSWGHAYHPPVLQWLLRHGASKDLKSANSAGIIPFVAAFSRVQSYIAHQVWILDIPVRNRIIQYFFGWFFTEQLPALYT